LDFLIHTKWGIFLESNELLLQVAKSYSTNMKMYPFSLAVLPVSLVLKEFVCRVRLPDL
jgi:hypothetical protein